MSTKNTLFSNTTVIHLNELSDLAKKTGGKKQDQVNESDESDQESNNDTTDSDEFDSEEEEDEVIDVEQNNDSDIDEDKLDDDDEDDKETGNSNDLGEIITDEKKNGDDEEGDGEGENTDFNLDCLLAETAEEDVYVDPVEATIKISLPKLTKYERVRILGTRAKQLALGAPPLVKNVSNKSPIEIAEIELMMNMIPFKIKRPLPNNTYEIWKLSELEK